MKFSNSRGEIKKKERLGEKSSTTSATHNIVVIKLQVNTTLEATKSWEEGERRGEGGGVVVS